MNAELIKILAQDEVRRANEPYLEWPSLFSNAMIPPQKDIDLAIKYLSSLSKDELESRLAIFNWEDAAMSKYRELVDSGSILLRRVIDVREWSLLEIANINLLLKNGIDKLRTPCEYFRWPNEFPGLYEELLSGTWKDFLSFEELKRKRQADLKTLYAWIQMWRWVEPLTDEDQHKLLKATGEDWEYIPFVEQIRRERALPERWYPDTSPYSKKELAQCLTGILGVSDEKPNEECLYQRKDTTETEELDYDEDYDFNKTWYLARDIQALVWYKNYLLKVKKDGVDFPLESAFISEDKGAENTEAPAQEEYRFKKRLKNENDGHQAMESSYTSYISRYRCAPRKPRDLMQFMAAFPPPGHRLNVTYQGRDVATLTVDNEKPLDHGAFSRRFRDYFTK